MARPTRRRRRPVSADVDVDDDGIQPRRRYRNSNALPTWAVGVITFSTIAVVGMVLVMIFKAQAGKIGPVELVAKARNHFDKEEYAEARALLATFPEDGSNETLKKRVKELLAEIDEREGKLERDHLNANAEQAYRNLKNHRQAYLQEDGKENNDPSRARYFVDYRCKSFLDKYGETEWASEVRRLKKKYEALYDSSKPFPDTWWDTRVVWEGEDKINHLGVCYKVMKDFLERNPDDRHAGDADTYMKRAETKAHDYLNRELKRSKGAREAGNFGSALTRMEKIKKNCSPIPSVLKKADEEIAAIERDHAAAQN